MSVSLRSSAQESLSGPTTSPRRDPPKRLPHGFRSFEFAMAAPAVLLLGLLSIVPFLMLVAMSFSDVSLLGGVELEFIGLANWTEVLGDTAIWASWRRSLVFVGSIVAVEMLLGLAFAVLLKELVRTRSLLLSVVLLPMFLAPVLVGLLSRFVLDSTIGLYGQLLPALGLDEGVFGDPTSAMVAVILIDVWEWTPLVALIMLAGLTSVPTTTIEAAAVDGAGWLRTLWSIVLPQVKGIILVALLIRSMDAIRYYDIITATTNGGPADATKIVPLKLYELAFRFDDQVGQAAVVGLMMLMFSILLAKVFVGLLAERDPAATRGGGRWR